MKTKIVGIRMTPALEHAARLAAEADGRTLSNYILRLIERDLAHALEHHGADTHKKSRTHRPARAA